MAVIRVFSSLWLLAGVLSNEGESFGEDFDDELEELPKVDDEIQDPNTALLNSYTFQTMLDQNKKDGLMVKFFAPWCGHCKRIKPVYSELAADLKASLKFAEVDCTDEDSKELCEAAGATSYPTLALFRDGKKLAYKGAQRKAEMVAWLNHVRANPYIFVDSEVDVFDPMHRHANKPMAVLGLFAKKEGKEWDTFEAFAFEQHVDVASPYTAMATFDKDTMKKLGVSPPAVVIIKDFDDKTNVFSGRITPSELQEFCDDQRIPLLGEADPDTFHQYIERELPVVWVFVDPAADTTEGVLEQARSAAQELREYALFLKADGIKWAEHAKIMGVTGLPSVVLHDLETKDTYVMDRTPVGQNSAEAIIAAFVALALDGGVEPFRRVPQTPIKAYQGAGSVMQLDEEAFEKITSETTKHSFVYFHAPWCQNCRQLMKRWTEFAEMVKSREDVVIAEMDVSEHHGFKEIAHYPNFRLYTAESKETEESPLPYHGERFARSWSEFLDKEAPVLPIVDAASDKKVHGEL